MKNLEAGANPMLLNKGIMAAMEVVSDHILRLDQAHVYAGMDFDKCNSYRICCDAAKPVLL